MIFLLSLSMFVFLKNYLGVSQNHVFVFLTFFRPIPERNKISRVKVP